MSAAAVLGRSHRSRQLSLGPCRHISLRNTLIVRVFQYSEQRHVAKYGLRR